MSYILDALRKAERDRHLGKTPSLADVTHAPIAASPPDRRRRLFALAALVLGLLVLAVMLRPAAPPVMTEPPSEPAVAAAVPQAATPTASPAPVPEPLGQEVFSPPEEVTEAPGDSVSMDDLLIPDNQIPTVVPDSAATVAPENRGEPVLPEASVNAGEAESLPGTGQTPAYKPLREMPADYRAAFASLRVDVHVYDADPARRWALIDGKKYVENATLPQGPRVLEITPEGIAFEFRGQTALLPLNR